MKGRGGGPTLGVPEAGNEAIPRMRAEKKKEKTREKSRFGHDLCHDLCESEGREGRGN